MADYAILGNTSLVLDPFSFSLSKSIKWQSNRSGLRAVCFDKEVQIIAVNMGDSMAPDGVFGHTRQNITSIRAFPARTCDVSDSDARSQPNLSVVRYLQTDRI